MANKYKPEKGLWTTEEYLADAALAALTSTAADGPVQGPVPVASPAIQHIRDLFEKAPYLKDAEGSLPGAHPVTWRDLADIATLTSTDRCMPTPKTANTVHYLSAIRERLESLYELLPDDARLREHISDEVDWLDAEIQRLATLPLTDNCGGRK